MKFTFAWSLLCLAVGVPFLSSAAETLNQPVDISQDFISADNTYFTPERVTAFDLATGAGKLK